MYHTTSSSPALGEIVLPSRLITCQPFQCLAISVPIATAYGPVAMTDLTIPRASWMLVGGILDGAVASGQGAITEQQPASMIRRKRNIQWVSRAIRRDGISLAGMCCTANIIACCDWQLMKPTDPVEPPSRHTGHHLAAGMGSGRSRQCCEVTSDCTGPIMVREDKIIGRKGARIKS